MKKINLLIFISISILLSGCAEKAPLKVGFIGSLTGSFADISIASRNAVTMAFEEINSRGGIKGRKLELLVRNDEGNPEKGVQAAEDLINEKVIAIFGPTLSTIAISLKPVIDNNKTVTISSTVSSSKLDDIDDYLIKFVSVKNRSRILSEVLTENKISTVVFVYDSKNVKFSNFYINDFEPVYEKENGKILGTVKYDLSENVSFSDTAESILGYNPSGIIFLGDNRTTALICQELKEKNYNGFLFSNAMTKQLIEHGGESIEGLMLISTFVANAENNEFVSFKKKYMERFSENPGFPAKRSYEAANAMITALLKNNDTELLKKTLLSIKKFDGLQGDLQMNRFGDVERPMYKFIIKNKEFVALDYENIK